MVRAPAQVAVWTDSPSRTRRSAHQTAEDGARVKSFIDFACFETTFPQLVAGPIIRFQEVADQTRADSFRRALGGWAAKRQSDLSQVMFIMSGDLVEFIPQRAYAVYTMHELQMATPLIVHAGIIDDCVANRFVYLPGDIERHLRIVKSLRPRVLIHHPYDRTRLAQHSTDAIEEDGLAVREVVQDIAN